MDDTNSTDDAARRERFAAKIIADIEAGRVLYLRGVAPLGRHLGMSAARTKQALEAGTLPKEYVITWQRDSGRWEALVRLDVPRHEESPPAQTFKDDLADLGRRLGPTSCELIDSEWSELSGTKAKRAFQAANALGEPIHTWHHNGRKISIWRKSNDQWIALTWDNDPQPPEDVPQQEETLPPAADQPVPIADGSENSTPSSGTSEGGPDDRARHDADIKVTAMIDRASDWRVSRRGNHYIDDLQGCHVVVWRMLGGWRFHVVHKATRVTWQSDPTRIATAAEARIAALAKLSKRLPEFLQRLAAERSRKPRDAG